MIDICVSTQKRQMPLYLKPTHGMVNFTGRMIRTWSKGSLSTWRKCSRCSACTEAELCALHLKPFQHRESNSCRDLRQEKRVKNAPLRCLGMQVISPAPVVDVVLKVYYFLPMLLALTVLMNRYRTDWCFHSNWNGIDICSRWGQ